MPTEAAYLEKAAEGVLRHLPDDDAQALRDWRAAAHRAGYAQARKHDEWKGRAAVAVVVVPTLAVVVWAIAWGVAAASYDTAVAECDARVTGIKERCLERLLDQPPAPSRTIDSTDRSDPHG